MLAQPAAQHVALQCLAFGAEQAQQAEHLQAMAHLVRLLPRDDPAVLDPRRLD